MSESEYEDFLLNQEMLHKSIMNEAIFDANTLSHQEMRKLRIGDKTVKKIINGRPWKSIDDLTAAFPRSSLIMKLTGESHGG